MSQDILETDLRPVISKADTRSFRSDLNSGLMEAKSLANAIDDQSRVNCGFASVADVTTKRPFDAASGRKAAANEALCQICGSSLKMHGLEA